MYLVEGEVYGIVSISSSSYRAVVTLATIGYDGLGEFAPQTPFSRVLASLVMLLGDATLAVPTGIVTGELIAARGHQPTTEDCPGCGEPAHDPDALHCRQGGAKL